MKTLLLFTIVVMAAELNASDVPVWIMAGQSNNQGRDADLSAARGIEQKHSVLFFGGTSSSARQWTLLDGPTERVNTSRGVEHYYGSEISAGQILARYYAGRVAIIKFSCWSTLDTDWSSNGNCWKTLVEMVDDAVGALSKTGSKPIVCGVWWMQGEDDAKTQLSASRYNENLRHFIQRCREQWNPNLRFIIGEISASEHWPFSDMVVQGQRNAAKMPNVHIVPTSDLPKIEDGMHLTTKSEIELGRRWASAATTGMEMTSQDLCESAPFVWNGTVKKLLCYRPVTGGATTEYKIGVDDARFGTGHGLASMIVENGKAYVFASRITPTGWRDVSVMTSTNLVDWTAPQILISRDKTFNTSVCRVDCRWVMAVEVGDVGTPFSVEFYESMDLINWQRVGQTFGMDRYTACPTIRYIDGWYYLIVLENVNGVYVSKIHRSQTLNGGWIVASRLFRQPCAWEGINASDIDLCEHDGKLHMSYSYGDQATWMKLQDVIIPRTMKDVFESCFR